MLIFLNIYKNELNIGNTRYLILLTFSNGDYTRQLFNRFPLLFYYE